MADQDQELSREEREARDFLTHELHFSVHKIPRGTAKTADFDVVGDEPSYLVEVKARFMREELENPIEDEPGAFEQSMNHDAKVNGWLADARSQFASVDPSHSRLWFIWSSMSSWLEPDTQLERVIRTLYGVRTAHDAMNPERQWVIYYAAQAAFERSRDIDGVIVVSPPDGMAFCANELSPRLNHVLRSQFVTRLRALGVSSVLPSERVATQPGYVVSPLARGDLVTVLRDCQVALRAPYLQFFAREAEYLQTGKIAWAADAAANEPE